MKVASCIVLKEIGMQTKGKVSSFFPPLFTSNSEMHMGDNYENFFLYQVRKQF